MSSELIEINEAKTRLAKRVAERFHSTPGEAAGLYLDDLHISYVFPHIVFRRSLRGRQAMVRDARLMVWELVQMTRAFHGDTHAVAAHLEIDALLVEEALQFADRYPQTVETAVRASESFALEQLKATFPTLEIFEARAAAEQG